MSRIGFEYALLRVVPHVERGESVNVGVLLYAQSVEHLAVATHVDVARLHALDGALDLAAIDLALAGIGAVCVGGPEAGAAGLLPPGQRFRWLVAPRSTVVQPGPIHTGVSEDITAEPARLLARLVATRDSGS